MTVAVTRALTCADSLIGEWRTGGLAGQACWVPWRKAEGNGVVGRLLVLLQQRGTHHLVREPEDHAKLLHEPGFVAFWLDDRFQGSVGVCGQEGKRLLEVVLGGPHHGVTVGEVAVEEPERSGDE